VASDHLNEASSAAPLLTRGERERETSTRKRMRKCQVSCVSRREKDSFIFILLLPSCPPSCPSPRHQQQPQPHRMEANPFANCQTTQRNAAAAIAPLSLSSACAPVMRPLRCPSARCPSRATNPRVAAAAVLRRHSRSRSDAPAHVSDSACGCRASDGAGCPRYSGAAAGLLKAGAR
jgi:hypothetical protein